MTMVMVMVTNKSLRADFFAETDIGLVRATNQDSYFVNNNQGICIVADGMGGHAGGEIASEICVDIVSSRLEEICKADTDSKRLPHIIRDAINEGSSAVFHKALVEPMLKGMGTTATVAVVYGNKIYIGHVGDSRLYLMRSGFLYQCTLDHSLVSMQVREGIITEEAAATHQLRNVITRSVGYQEQEEVDVSVFDLKVGDKLLICSDGLHGKVGPEELASLLDTASQETCNQLIEKAKKAGGEEIEPKNTIVTSIDRR